MSEKNNTSHQMSQDTDTGNHGFDLLISQSQTTPSHWWYSNYSGEYNYYRNEFDNEDAPAPPQQPDRECIIM